MSPLVFISHSSQDRAVATKICDALERRGLGCWLASRDIGPGENFQEAIVKAIRSVRAMVLVFTANANNSSEIKKEMALASQNRLVVIPVRVEDVLPSDAFLYELSTRQWIDGFDDWERAIGRLADQISGIAGEDGATPALPPGAVGPGRSAKARPQRARTIWLASAAVAALVVAGGLAYRIAMERAQPAATPTPPSAAAASAPAPHRDISGKWVTEPLINPYDRKQKSILQFEFEQSGETLFGTVSEKSDLGGAMKGIQGGEVKGDDIVFYTQGVSATGSAEQPYKENYRGTLKGSEIEFVRQNDVASGGLPQKFTAKRE
ncbi:MAG TPA: toll/interleukin-1 receptor domain-containing protein [Alphaproteobacteria bacterium]|nr:toll/interleukin-1 receptor domain-containing protein [Alphaproteobacteria bacterium]